MAIRARVAERQTQGTQNPPLATACEFESHLGHHRDSAGPLDQRLGGLFDAILPDASESWRKSKTWGKREELHPYAMMHEAL